MKVRSLHRWDISPAEAKKVQEELRGQVNSSASLDWARVRLVAAADVSFARKSPFLFGAVVLVNFPELTLHSVYYRQAEARFPYVPGYLSFREAPVLLEIFRTLPVTPDVLLCDGQGIAHPRFFGLASHLGLLLDLPTVGCAKSLLVGEFSPPGREKGSVAPIRFQEREVGAAVRTRSGVQPVYVSVGHKITLKDAIELVLKCSPRFRIPEPLRLAHQQVNRYREAQEPLSA